MVGFIRRAFDKTLQNAEWMDNVTRESALHKSRLMEVMVGYPKEILLESDPAKTYEGVSKFSLFS